MRPLPPQVVMVVVVGLPVVHKVMPLLLLLLRLDFRWGSPEKKAAVGEQQMPLVRLSHVQRVEC